MGVCDANEVKMKWISRDTGHTSCSRLFVCPRRRRGGGRTRDELRLDVGVSNGLVSCVHPPGVGYAVVIE